VTICEGAIWLEVMGLSCAETVSFEEGKGGLAGIKGWETCIGMREFESKYPHLPLPSVCFVAILSASHHQGGVVSKLSEQVSWLLTLKVCMYMVRNEPKCRL
jgi:hypothetical protein